MMKLHTKKLAVFLTALSICSLACGVVKARESNKARLQNASLENSFIKLTVEQNKDVGEYLKYRLDSTGGSTLLDDDDNKNLTYKYFYSGYTTININSAPYIYGTGEDVSKPYYDADNKCHVSEQKFENAVIRQTLTLSELDTPDYDDALKISYKVVNADPEDKIGVRIMIDPMLDDDDTLRIYANNAQLTNEAEFIKEVPDVWTVKQLRNENFTTYGKFSKDDIKPDKFVIADWNSLFDSKWDADININRQINDAAAAYTWEPVSDASGNEYTVYYGIKNAANTGKDNETKLSSPKTGIDDTVKIYSCFILSMLSAAGCIVLFKKGEKHE